MQKKEPRPSNSRNDAAAIDAFIELEVSPDNARLKKMYADLMIRSSSILTKDENANGGNIVPFSIIAEEMVDQIEITAVSYQ